MSGMGRRKASAAPSPHPSHSKIRPVRSVKGGAAHQRMKVARELLARGRLDPPHERTAAGGSATTALVAALCTCYRTAPTTRCCRPPAAAIDAREGCGPGRPGAGGVDVATPAPVHSRTHRVLRRH
jgi:hypothetical protein